MGFGFCCCVPTTFMEKFHFSSVEAFQIQLRDPRCSSVCSCLLKYTSQVCCGKPVSLSMTCETAEYIADKSGRRWINIHFMLVVSLSSGALFLTHTANASTPLLGGGPGTMMEAYENNGWRRIWERLSGYQILNSHVVGFTFRMFMGTSRTTKFPLNGRLKTAAAVKLTDAPISLRHVMSQGQLYCGGHNFPA